MTVSAATGGSDAGPAPGDCGCHLIPRKCTHRTLSDHQTRCATEESTFRLLMACRDAPDRPRLAFAWPQRPRGLPRPASRGPTVDSSALQPVSHSSGDSVAGPRMTDRVFIRQGASSAVGFRKPMSLPRTCGRGGSSSAPFAFHATARRDASGPSRGRWWRRRDGAGRARTPPAPLPPRRGSGTRRRRIARSPGSPRPAIRSA
jgi:hypothetical protein